MMKDSNALMNSVCSLRFVVFQGRREMEEGDIRRSTRPSNRHRFRIPNAEHYVGYVEDDETPEMIMKKFEEFERVIPTNDLVHSRASHLTEAELNRVFEATSSFSIREAYEESHLLSDDDQVCESDDEFQLTEDEDQDEDDDVESGRVNGKHRRQSRRGDLRSTENGEFKDLSKRNRSRNAIGIIHLRIPSSPLPVSWGRIVRPFGMPIDPPQRPVVPSISQSYPDLADSDLTGFYRKFLGVMINPVWTQKKDSEMLLKSLPIIKLCPEGFLFIWIPKGFLQIIWKLTTSWGYSYVESLTWIQLKANNKVHRLQKEENRILPESHLTLYIFRKGGKKIEIKHQRSSDLFFDVFDPQREFRVPQEVYNVIETMLPGSSGKLLELWAPRTVLRDGWMHLNEGQY